MATLLFKAKRSWAASSLKHLDPPCLYIWTIKRCLKTLFETIHTASNEANHLMAIIILCCLEEHNIMHLFVLLSCLGSSRNTCSSSRLLFSLSIVSFLCSGMLYHWQYDRYMPNLWEDVFTHIQTMLQIPSSIHTYAF